MFYKMFWGLAQILSKKSIDLKNNKKQMSPAATRITVSIINFLISGRYDANAMPCFYGMAINHETKYRRGL